MQNINYKELEIDELLIINGGGLFKDFGKWCKETWCSIKDFELEYPEKSPGMTWNEYNGKF
ncbi:hypothetical protein LB450_03380 [Psychroflexus sp. CAK1W]|uniref:hypothetical protein n=1 Tax=Psychroflexus curvus TaxID=2873595 RepID=UPI001CCBA2E3|nr:hypothetical protein [Psychroflexus curvus]MBZ9627137.1 hypothetical protein [Psychroflexus curvus]